MADYIFLLETRFSTEQQAVVAYMQRLCRQAGMNLYLTGGPMRDLLAGAPIRTLDFTVEGNPLRLEKTLAADGTELLFLNQEEQSLRLRRQGVRFRVTAAHSEIFEQPGRPPVLKPATIIDDLRHRGFTLDAIGLSLNAASRGLLLDPTNGLADIEARQIRMIHNYVFYEDPVRLLRAVRLQTRLAFTLEERTAARMAAAQEGQYLDHAYKNSLGREFEAIAYEPDVAAVVKALEKAELLEPALGKGVRTGKMHLAALAHLPAVLQQLDEVGLTPDSGPVALHFLLSGLPEKDQSRLLHLPMSKPLVAACQQLPAEAKTLQKRLLGREAANLAGLHDLLHRARPEAVLFLYLTGTQAKVVKKIKDFIARIPEIRQQLPLRELQQMGVHADAPAFHDVIEKVYRRLLEGKLRTPVEILAALRQEAEKAGAIAPPAPPKPPAGKPRAEKLKAGAAHAAKAGAARPVKAAPPPRAKPQAAKPKPEPKPKPKPKPAPPRAAKPSPAKHKKAK